MGALTTVGTFLGNLRDDLAARAGLEDVAIYTGPVDDVSVGQEAIVFAAMPMDVGYRFPTAPGREVFEEYLAEGRIWVVQAGAGEDVIVATRERAIEILGEVHDALDAHLTTPASQSTFGVDDARIDGWSLEQLVGDGYRDCRLTFTVAVKARFTPS